MHSVRKRDAGLLTFVSFLYQLGGWWLLLVKDAASLAFFLFAVALVLGLWGLRLRSMKDGAS